MIPHLSVVVWPGVSGGSPTALMAKNRPSTRRSRCALVDEWQLTEIGSDRYVELGTLLVANTVRNIYHIGPVGEAPEVFIRSNRLHNFTPVEGVVYISHLESGHSDQWYVSE